MRVPISIPTVFLFCLCKWEAWGQPPASHLEQMDSWASRRTFVWEASITYTLTEKSKSEVYRAQTILNIARFGATIQVSGDGFGLSPTGFKRNGLLKFSQKGYILDASDYGISNLAAVWPIEGDILTSINHCDYGGYVFPPARLFVGYFAGSNPLNWLNVGWEVVRTDADTWLLKTRPSSGQDRKNPFLYPEVLARLTLSRKHRGAPLSLQLEYGGLKITYKTNKFTSISGFWIPQEVQYTEISGNKESWVARLEVSLQLIRVVETPKIMLQLPSRTQVNDFRLAGKRFTYLECIQVTNQRRHVTYFWNGYLPDAAELRRLALAQGKLAPEPSRFRFAWWLVVPGVLLVFASIFYYWRLRRRVS